nr:hypothetical protein [Tanacetum cinerariifolium]
MAEPGFGAYWSGSEIVIPDKGDLRDYWIGQEAEKVTGVDLFYLRTMDDETANVLYLLAQYLFHHAEGRKNGARLSEGHFIGRLAAHFGLPQTMSHKIDRLEEEVRKTRRSVAGLREVFKSSIIEHTRVSTWMISCMKQLMDASGRTYQAFDNTLVDCSRLSYERCVRPKTGKASTSKAPQTDDKPDP